VQAVLFGRLAAEAHRSTHIIIELVGLCQVQKSSLTIVIHASQEFLIVRVPSTLLPGRQLRLALNAVLPSSAKQVGCSEHDDAHQEVLLRTAPAALFCSAAVSSMAKTTQRIS
jgi:hypothetical protein